MTARRLQTNSGAETSAEEEAFFLKEYDPTRYKHPSVTVDVVLLTVRERSLLTLVVRRSDHPFKGRWALPGGFVQVGEPLRAAASRVLKTKCSLGELFIEQLATFGEPARDPRTRVISVAYYALVDFHRFDKALARGGDVNVGRVNTTLDMEGKKATVVDDSGDAMPLAFDHEEILGVAVQRLRGKLDYSPVGFQLLPKRFTLFDLQTVHETVLGRPLNKDSFRRRMLMSGQLQATGEVQRDVGHRPAELYRFVKRSAI